MESLVQALRLSKAPKIAFVGAGGKTTALFTLARQLVGMGKNQETSSKQNTVLVTTTTHLATWQTNLADLHIHIGEVAPLPFEEGNIPTGIVLVTGLYAGDERMEGLTGPAMKQLWNLTDSQQIPLLIEADGSRMRPLKAPGEHEPAIPEFVDSVVVVAGLSALGKPLSMEWVFRPEIYARLSGLLPGEKISTRAIQQVLTHPEGGLKNIPGYARRIALLNQADTAELRHEADQMVRGILKQYHAVVLASLGKGDNSPALVQREKMLQIVSPGEASPEAAIYSIHESVAGIILAAGGSKRLGQPKQMIPWRGHPLVWHVAKTALAAGLDPVIVVTGAYTDQVEAALKGLPVTVLFNQAWEMGQSTSLRVGLRSVPENTGGALFFLADQPMVSVELVYRLVKEHSSTLAPLVAPLVNGSRANPVLFDRVTFGDLLALEGDVGGRVLFGDSYHYPVTWVSWEDPNLLLDIDTPEDYERFRQMEGTEGVK